MDSGYMCTDKSISATKLELNFVLWGIQPTEYITRPLYVRLSTTRLNRGKNEEEKRGKNADQTEFIRVQHKHGSHIQFHTDTYKANIMQHWENDEFHINWDCSVCACVCMCICNLKQCAQAILCTFSISKISHHFIACRLLLYSLCCRHWHSIEQLPAVSAIHLDA